MIHKQIVIVGGGPVGLTAALYLVELGYKVTILDANFINEITDGRVLALSYGSADILRSIQAWDKSFVTPIKQVHISHSGIGISKISNTDVNLPELGYTVRYKDLCNSLRDKVSQCKDIELLNTKVTEVMPGRDFTTVFHSLGNGQEECLTADIVILAEGGKIKPENLDYKLYDYKQSAIIAHLIPTSNKERNVAFERFDDSGALVLLPFEAHYVLVWSRPQEQVAEKYNTNTLLEDLSKLSFMKRFGGFKISSDIYTFPLKLQVAKKRVLDRLILLGNSSQIVHPISAQGLNLGLRDVSNLLEILSTINNLDNAAEKLNGYDKLRQRDARFVIGFTHLLARFMEQKSPIINHLRGIGLIGLGNCRIIQNKLANSLIFGI